MLLEHLEKSFGKKRSSFLASEAKAFADLSQTPQSKSLVHVFFLQDEAKKLENKNSKKANQLKGLLNYWKGMSYSRINEFDKAIEYFSKAIELKYETEDLFYEYGQVLYVADKFKKARI